MIDDAKFGNLPYSHIKKYDKKVLRRCYRYLFEKSEKEYGLKWYKANVLWYNKKTKLFNKGWEMKNGKWTVVHDFGYDFIFDKTKLSGNSLKYKKYFEKKVKILNSTELEILCSDKWLTRNTFKQYMPKTYLVHDIKQLKSKLKYIKSDKIVLKPRFGSSAIGLTIIKKSQLPQKIPRDTILQEFVDTSKGIPDLVKGVHDIRSIVIDGKFIHSFIRVPKAGWISNLSRGGHAIFVDKNKTPKKLVDFVINHVDKKLTKLKPRFYTVDCVYVDGKIVLVELNSKPGFFFYEGFGRNDLRDLVIDNLLNAIKESI